MFLQRVVSARGGIQRGCLSNSTVVTSWSLLLRVPRASSSSSSSITSSTSTTSARSFFLPKALSARHIHSTLTSHSRSNSLYHNPLPLRFFPRFYTTSSSSRRVFSFQYVLTNNEGKTVESSTTPLSFLEGGNQIIPGLESKIVNLKVGDEANIKVPWKDAYGARNSALELKVARNKFEQNADKVQIGDQFVNSGNPEVPLTVVKITDTEVFLDGNHPLAEMDLTFDVKISDIRDATEEEIKHGHSHGPGSHHHH